MVNLHVYRQGITPLRYTLISKPALLKDSLQGIGRKNIEFIGWQFLDSLYFDEHITTKPYRIRFMIFVDKESTGIPSIPALEQTLSNNLLQLISDGKYSDVILLSEEGKSFNAHKVILDKRSEVFRANFQHTTDVNSIKTSLKEDILHQMLVYIYSDTHPEPADITTDLFRAADYYQLLGLKTICAAALCSQLKVENAVTTLELAVQHHSKEMVDFIISYIKRQMDLVTQTEDWKNLSSMEIIKVIFENGLTK